MDRSKMNKDNCVCSICGQALFSSRNKRKYCSDECEKQAIRNRNRERYRKANPGWNKSVDKECEHCGKHFSVSARKSNIARFCSEKCRNTFNNRVKGIKSLDDWIEIRNEMRETQEKLRKEQRKVELEARIIERTCDQCGAKFKTLQPNQVTCSTECSKTRKRRRNDKRLNKDNIVDRDISLATLYKRDKGICYICDKLCNFEDCSKDDRNNVIVGKTYPTIDHIIPIARGGKHAWDNIRLAHHLCNSIKSDSIPNKVKELMPDNAYVLARKISSKRKSVKQFSKEGRLISMYESTASAETITGIKQKGIQKCAREEVKTYGGFVWRY